MRIVKTRIGLGLCRTSLLNKSIGKLIGEKLAIKQIKQEQTRDIAKAKALKNVDPTNLVGRSEHFKRLEARISTDRNPNWKAEQLINKNLNCVLGSNDVSDLESIDASDENVFSFS